MRKRIKNIILTQFPKKRYSISSSVEELNSWYAKDLKELCLELGLKPFTKDINKNIIRDCILYANGLMQYQLLIRNPFIEFTT